VNNSNSSTGKARCITHKESKKMNNENTTHNGWTNYATWRVNLEMFDGLDQDGWNDSSADDCKDYAEMLIENESTGAGFALDYAMAFLQDVNWQEIADSLNDNA